MHTESEWGFGCDPEIGRHEWRRFRAMFYPITVHDNRRCPVGAVSVGRVGQSNGGWSNHDVDYEDLRLSTVNAWSSFIISLSYRFAATRLDASKNTNLSETSLIDSWSNRAATYTLLIGPIVSTCTRIQSLYLIWWFNGTSQYESQQERTRYLRLRIEEIVSFGFYAAIQSTGRNFRNDILLRQCDHLWYILDYEGRIGKSKRVSD